MNRIAIALATLSIAGSVFAATETFVIDTNHTAPRFEYNHFGYSNQLHRFDKTSGKIMIDRAAHTGAVDVTIDATSINTGFPMFNQHLQSEDYFDTGKHPTITFKSTAVKFDGDKPVAVDGNLTIKGVTRPATLTVTSFQLTPHPLAKKDAIGANAVTHIKRSDFNMGKYAPHVSDEVTLTIAVEAIKE